MRYICNICTCLQDKRGKVFWKYCRRKTGFQSPALRAGWGEENPPLCCLSDSLDVNMRRTKTSTVFLRVVEGRHAMWVPWLTSLSLTRRLLRDSSDPFPLLPGHPPVSWFPFHFSLVFLFSRQSEETPPFSFRLTANTLTRNDFSLPPTCVFTAVPGTQRQKSLFLC